MKFQISTRTTIRSIFSTSLICAFSFSSWADPPNDDCSDAILLVTGSSCVTTSGTLKNGSGAANPTAGINNFCGDDGSPDVWYKFVAQTAFPVITLSGMGSNMDNSPRLQLFATTSCAAADLNANSIACVSGTNTATLTLNTSTAVGGAGLTVGATYLVRVFTNSTTTSGTASRWDFDICISEPGRVIGAGNSYVNISKKDVGGIVEPGDTLEIRSSYYWHQNYDGTNSFSRARFYDSVPSHTTMLTPSIGGDTLLRVITNEGLTVGTSKYTYANNDDRGAYNASPGAGRYQIRMNIGSSSGNTPSAAGTAGNLTDYTGAGTIDPNTTLPKASGGSLITFSYYVVVTGTIGDIIQLAASKFSYRKSSGTDTTITLTPYKIYISPYFNGLCPNSTSINVASEFGGTFGSGNTMSRPTVLEAPIPAYSWRSNVSTTNAIGDGYYGIVNNLSPTGSTNVNSYHVPNCTGAPAGYECANRMHGGHWDIMGDHTGTNNSIGNPPVAPGATGGYMLAVNADMVMSEAFRQTLTDLCPGTYYEYSAWVKNICTTCGIDVNAVSTNKPGVLPNLTFSVDGMDYYSSGMIDTVGWVKKGFIFQTGPTQSTATIAIRNNAPGGGGNDWVMDDISIATCLPSMSYSPSSNPNVCSLNSASITDTVESYFPNYVYYKWQRSTDNGDNWTDITGATGPVSSVDYDAQSSTYSYTTEYIIPPTWSDTSNNGDLYRVIAATTPDNLGSSNCVTTTGIPFLTVNVLDCGIPLKSDLLSFSGKLVNEYAHLSWATSKEEAPIKYHIERSNDGTHFMVAGTINGYNNINNSMNQYSFVDPSAVAGKVYYRLSIETSASKKYSRTVQLSKQNETTFAIGRVVNPFNHLLNFDVTVPTDTRIDAELVDIFGKTIKKQSYVASTGANMLYMGDTGSLPSGTYILRVRSNGKILSRKVVKGNNL